MSLNCWEAKRCGREPGGRMEGALGVCPASICTRAAGVNHGTNGGRACWAVCGTLCNGTVQATFASKIGSCLSCDFYRVVRREEGADFQGARFIRAVIERPDE